MANDDYDMGGYVIPYAPSTQDISISRGFEAGTYSYEEAVAEAGGFPAWVEKQLAPEMNGGRGEVLMAGGLNPLALLPLLPTVIKAGAKAIPAIGGALAGLPSWLLALLGVGAGAAGVAALTANGGAGQVIPGTDIPLGGPFAPEPYGIIKEWAGIGGSRFYKLSNGRVAVRKRDGTWKLVKRPAMLHMKTSNPRMGDVVRADKIVQRVCKILKRRLR